MSLNYRRLIILWPKATILTFEVKISFSFAFMFPRTLVSFVIFGWFMKIPGRQKINIITFYFPPCVFLFSFVFPNFAFKVEAFLSSLFFSSCFDPLFLHTQFLIFLSCFVFSFSFAPPSPIITLFVLLGRHCFQKQADRFLV